MMTRNEALRFLLTQPYKLGHMVGFTRLTPLNNEWIVDMVQGSADTTLQAHRESYKTTCVSVALALLCVLLPNVRTLFLRKTDANVKEIVAQVKKILESPQLCALAACIYGVAPRLTVSSAWELSTNLTTDPRGTAQLCAMGMGGSLTGKHYDRIFTDDIVNVQDRISRAERERTKLIYQELQNLRNRGGRIYNTGTPWHKEDAFSIMPEARRYDCYTTGLLTPEQIKAKRDAMTASLFAANYELRHIAAEDVIFSDAHTGADAELCCDGLLQIDAAYGGSDSTAATVCRRKDGSYYLLGKLWNGHVDDRIDALCALYAACRCGKVLCEDNGDKGYLAKELRRRGLRVVSYHESMNKFLKITSYLKAAWKDVQFCAGTDDAYLSQILDYNENAEHDDAPDSAASAVRSVYFKQESTAYVSPFGG